MIIRLFGFQLLFNFYMEHFLLLFSESVARFCKYSGAGCACYLLYDRKLSGEEIFGISFCSLSLWLLLATYLNGYILMYN